MTSRLLSLIIPFAVTVQCVSAGAGYPSASQDARSSSCGRVVAVWCVGPSSAVTLQLADAKESSSWRIVIPSERRRLFGSRIEDRYDQQLVCVAPGSAATARSGQILVRDPTELVVKDTTQAPIARPDDVFRTCDPEVELPVPVRQVHANFTLAAMRAKVHGSVFLEGVVDGNGAVSNVRVVQSLEPSLDAAARDAFAQWEFRPATRRGEPVAMAVSAEMTFVMR
jgi:TonB family protein